MKHLKQFLSLYGNFRQIHSSEEKGIFEETIGVLSTKTSAKRLKAIITGNGILCVSLPKNIKELLQKS